MGPMVGNGRSARLKIARGKLDIDRFGSKTEVPPLPRRVRSTFKNGHRPPRQLFEINSPCDLAEWFCRSILPSGGPKRRYSGYARDPSAPSFSKVPTQ
jgi:hypothetical protein